MKMMTWALALLAPALAWIQPGHTQTQTSADAPMEVEILHQKIVQQGGRTITYNIITPPPELPPDQSAAQDTPLSQEESQILQEQAQKPVKAFIVESTAYASGVTEFQWHHDGAVHYAYSNADFTLFPAMTVLEGAEELYQFTFLSGEGTEVPPGVPAPGQFSAEHTEYLVVADPQPPGDHNAAFAPFDALHAYYETAEGDLLTARTAAAAAQAAREQELLENPPQPEDITVNFWPIKSRLYLSE